MTTRRDLTGPLRGVVFVALFVSAGLVTGDTLDANEPGGAVVSV
jgi:hypothetical protein